MDHQILVACSQKAESENLVAWFICSKITTQKNLIKKTFKKPIYDEESANILYSQK